MTEISMEIATKPSIAKSVKGKNATKSLFSLVPGLSLQKCHHHFVCFCGMFLLDEKAPMKVMISFCGWWHATILQSAVVTSMTFWVLQGHSGIVPITWLAAVKGMHVVLCPQRHFFAHASCKFYGLPFQHTKRHFCHTSKLTTTFLLMVGVISTAGVIFVQWWWNASWQHWTSFQNICTESVDKEEKHMQPSMLADNFEVCWQTLIDHWRKTTTWKNNWKCALRSKV